MGLDSNGFANCFIACACTIAFLQILIGQAVGQATIVSVQPCSVQPGVKAKLSVRGTKLPSNLRVATDRDEVKIAIESVADGEAVLAVEVPNGTRPGPIGLWFATPTGPLGTRFILVDDLPIVSDQGNNHSTATCRLSVRSMPSMESAMVRSRITIDFRLLLANALRSK